jgi:hypothetical protein
VSLLVRSLALLTTVPDLVAGHTAVVHVAVRSAAALCAGGELNYLHVLMCSCVTLCTFLYVCDCA